MTEGMCIIKKVSRKIDSSGNIFEEDVLEITAHTINECRMHFDQIRREK